MNRDNHVQSWLRRVLLVVATTALIPFGAVVIGALGPAGVANASTVTGNVNCESPSPHVPGITFEGNVTVTGACTLVGDTVIGNVKVLSGARFLDVGSTIEGNLVADNAHSTENPVDLEGTHIDGNLEVQGSSSNPTGAIYLCDITVAGSVKVQTLNLFMDCGPDTITGNLVAENFPAPVRISSASVQGSIEVTGNTGGVTMNDNQAGGNCQAINNSPAATGSGNTADGINQGCPT